MSYSIIEGYFYGILPIKNKSYWTRTINAYNGTQLFFCTDNNVLVNSSAQYYQTYSIVSTFRLK